MEQDSSIGRPLHLVEVGAVLRSVGTIVHIVILRDVPNALGPIPCPLGPLGICFIVCVPRETSGDVEEDNVGNSILVIVAVVGMGNLPAETTGAVLVLPPGGLGVEGGLGEREILRVSGRRVGEVDLGGQHSRHAPETLIIVAERGGPVGVHKGKGRSASLVDDGSDGLVVVCAIACVVPVVDQGAEHCAGLPPVIVAGRWRAWQNARCLAWLVTAVILPEVGSNDFGGSLDGI